MNNDINSEPAGLVVDSSEKNSSSFFQKIWGGIKWFCKNETVRYIGKRLLHSLITIFLLVAIVTALIRLVPESTLVDWGTYNKLYGQSKAAAERFYISELYRYGRVTIQGEKIPVISSILQYYYWMLPIYKEVPVRWSTDYTRVIGYWKGFIYLGRSTTENAYVTDILTDKMGISFLVSILSTLIAYVFAIPLGVAMAKKPGGVIDKIGTVFIVLNYAIPALVFYLVVNKLFINTPFTDSYIPSQPYTILIPVLCISFLSIPGLIIWIRRFMVDELNSDYVKFARSKGLSENTIMYKHVLRNACIPLIRNLPATFIGAIVGSYFVEQIWHINGTGRILISVLQKTDVAAIQGLTVIYAVLSIVSFLLGDIITVFFDPRIKLED